jgi:hypothetical protein
LLAGLVPQDFQPERSEADCYCMAPQSDHTSRGSSSAPSGRAVY